MAEAKGEAKPGGKYGDKCIQLKGKWYLETKYRIQWFRDDHKAGDIRTEIVSLNPLVVKATIVDENGQALATAHAGAKESPGAVWSGRAVEKAETAAIGRALGHAGYGTQFAGEGSDDDEADSGHLADSPVQPAQAPVQPAQAAPKKNGNGNGKANGGARWTLDGLKAATADLFDHPNHFDAALALYVNPDSGEYLGLTPDVPAVEAEARVRLYRAQLGKMKTPIFAEAEARAKFLSACFDVLLMDEAQALAALRFAAPEAEIVTIADWRGCKVTAWAAALAKHVAYNPTAALPDGTSELTKTIVWAICADVAEDTATATGK